MLQRRPEYPTAAEAGLSEANVVDYGNINLNLRPIVKGPNGEIYTIFSITITEKYSDNTRVFTIIPTVSDDGAKLNDNQANSLYAQTRRHLGRFSTLKDANTYASFLSRREGQKYRQQIKNNIIS